MLVGGSSSAGSLTDRQLAAPSAEEQFAGDGFTIAVPAGWRVERMASDSVAVYDHDPAADASSSVCKIEVSAFPFAPSDDEGAWIAARIGADPSLKVVEESSGDVAVNGGTGVRWDGMIDGVPTTLVYAFSANRAYEIAPSVVSNVAGAAGTDAATALCDDALDTILSQFSMQ